MSTKLIKYLRKTIYGIQLHKRAHARHGAWILRWIFWTELTKPAFLYYRR